MYSYSDFILANKPHVYWKFNDPRKSVKFRDFSEHQFHMKDVKNEAIYYLQPNAILKNDDFPYGIQGPGGRCYFQGPLTYRYDFENNFTDYELIGNLENNGSFQLLINPESTPRTVPGGTYSPFAQFGNIRLGFGDASPVCCSGCAPLPWIWFSIELFRLEAVSGKSEWNPIHSEPVSVNPCDASIDPPHMPNFSTSECLMSLRYREENSSVTIDLRVSALIDNQYRYVRRTIIVPQSQKFFFGPNGTDLYPYDCGTGIAQNWIFVPNSRKIRFENSKISNLAFFNYYLEDAFFDRSLEIARMDFQNKINTNQKIYYHGDQLYDINADNYLSYVLEDLLCVGSKFNRIKLMTVSGNKGIVTFIDINKEKQKNIFSGFRNKYAVGEWISIDGTTIPVFNQIVRITKILSDTSFEFDILSQDGSAIGGIIKLAPLFWNRIFDFSARSMTIESVGLTDIETIEEWEVRQNQINQSLFEKISDNIDNPLPDVIPIEKFWEGEKAFESFVIGSNVVFTIEDVYPIPFAGSPEYTDTILTIPGNKFSINHVERIGTEYVGIANASLIRFTENTSWNNTSEWKSASYIKSYSSVPNPNSDYFDEFPQFDPVSAVRVNASLIVRSSDGVNWIRDSSTPPAYTHEYGFITRTFSRGIDTTGTIESIVVKASGSGYTWAAATAHPLNGNSFSADLSVTISGGKITNVSVVRQSGSSTGCTISIVITGDGTGAKASAICGTIFTPDVNTLSFNTLGKHDLRSGTYMLGKTERGFGAAIKTSLPVSTIMPHISSDSNHPVRNFYFSSPGSGSFIHSDVYQSTGTIPFSIGDGLFQTSDDTTKVSSPKIFQWLTADVQLVTLPEGVSSISTSYKFYDGYYYLINPSTSKFITTNNFSSWSVPIAINQFNINELTFSNHGIYKNSMRIESTVPGTLHSTSSFQTKKFKSLSSVKNSQNIRILNDSILYFVEDESYPSGFSLYQINPIDFISCNEEDIPIQTISKIRYLNYFGDPISNLFDNSNDDEFFSLGGPESSLRVKKNLNFDWLDFSKNLVDIPRKSGNGRLTIQAYSQTTIFKSSPYQIQPTATNGYPPFSWSISNNPTSIAIDPISGNVSGDFSSVDQGTTTFTVTVKDFVEDEVSVDISISVLNDFELLNPSFYVLWKAENLPPGVSINQSTGLISGSVSTPQNVISTIKAEYRRGNEVIQTLSSNANFHVYDLVTDISFSFFDPNTIIISDVINFTTDIEIRSVDSNFRVNVYGGEIAGFESIYENEFNVSEGINSKVNLDIKDSFSIKNVYFDQIHHSIIDIKSNKNRTEVIGIFKSIDQQNEYNNISCLFESNDMKNWTQISQVPVSFFVNSGKNRSIDYRFTDTSFGWIVICDTPEGVEYLPYEDPKRYLFLKKNSFWKKVDFYDLFLCYPYDVFFCNGLTFITAKDETIDNRYRVFYTSDGIQFNEISYPIFDESFESSQFYSNILYNGNVYVLVCFNMLFISSNLHIWERKYIVPPNINGVCSIRKIDSFSGNKLVFLLDNSIKNNVPPLFDSRGLYLIDNLSMDGNFFVEVKWAGFETFNFIKIENLCFTNYNNTLIQLDLNSFVSCDKKIIPYISCKKCLDLSFDYNLKYCSLGSRVFLMNSNQTILNARINSSPFDVNYEKWGILDFKDTQVFDLTTPSQNFYFKINSEINCKGYTASIFPTASSINDDSPEAPVPDEEKKFSFRIKENLNGTSDIEVDKKIVVWKTNNKPATMNVSKSIPTSGTNTPSIYEKVIVKPETENERTFYCLFGDHLRFYFVSGWYHTSSSSHNILSFGKYKNFFDNTKEEIILQGYVPGTSSVGFNFMNQNWDWEILDSGHVLCRPNVSQQNDLNQIVWSNNSIEINKAKSDGGIYIFPILTTNAVNR